VVEALQGPAAAERFRRDGDPGFNGDISARFYLKHAAAGFDTALIAMREGVFPQRNMGGTKGAFVFDMLAAEVGRDRFRGAIAGILDRYEWDRIGLRAFVLAIGAAAGRDLEWFYDQWFTRSGAPTFAVSWRQDGARLTGSVTQDTPFYRVSLPLWAESADSGTATRVVAVDGPRTDFTMTVPFVVDRVVPDPRFRVLHWSGQRRAAAEAIAPLTRAAVRASVEEFRAALRQVPAADVHAFEFTAHLGIARLLLETGPADSAKAHLRQALDAPTRDPEELSLVYALLAVLADRAGDTAGVRWAVERAVAADVDAGIAGASVWARGLLRPARPARR
jgi:hypothetical protein